MKERTKHIDMAPEEVSRREVTAANHHRVVGSFSNTEFSYPNLSGFLISRKGMNAGFSRH